MNTTEMMVICREVDRATGKIAVYQIETEVTESLIFKLRLRARLNPELQYFVTTKAHYEGFGDTITAVLKRRTVTPAAIARVGGIVQLWGGARGGRKSRDWRAILVCYGHLGTLLPCPRDNRCRERRIRRIPCPLGYWRKRILRAIRRRVAERAIRNTGRRGGRMSKKKRLAVWICGKGGELS